MAKESDDALYVESPNDQFSIIHLMKRHGIPFDALNRPVNVKSMKNDQGVLESMTVAVKAGVGHTVGFVLDADDSIVRRWKQITANPLAVPVVIKRQRKFGGIQVQLTGILEQLWT